MANDYLSGILRGRLGVQGGASTSNDSPAGGNHLQSPFQYGHLVTGPGTGPGSPANAYSPWLGQPGGSYWTGPHWGINPNMQQVNGGGVARTLFNTNGQPMSLPPGMMNQIVANNGPVGLNRPGGPGGYGNTDTGGGPHPMDPVGPIGVGRPGSTDMGGGNHPMDPVGPKWGVGGPYGPGEGGGNHPIDPVGPVGHGGPVEGGGPYPVDPVAPRGGRRPGMARQMNWWEF